MTREQYVEARKAALLAMTTEDLAITVNDYFVSHATMPGEKDLKDAAGRILANIAENPGFAIDDETRTSMVEKFAGICVREMKVEGLLVKNVTKENKDDFSILKPTELGLVETQSIPAEGKSPAKKVFEAPASIKNGTVVVGDYEIGRLSEGFVKNNPGVDCSATLVATDYSNGKFSNMSYVVIADIAA